VTRRALVIGLACLLVQSAQGQGSATERPFVPANRWALVVGASAYSPEVGPLRYTAKEAREFAGVLQDRLGFTPENVKLLADGGTQNEAPSSANIVQALDTLLANPRLDRANLFVFYFSGHGIGTSKGDFLIPTDAKPSDLETVGVPVKTLIEKIVAAGLKNVLFIADACRSGEANEFGGEFIELCRRSNLAVILGSAPGKRAYEYPRLKRGAFTHFLLESLSDTTLRDESGTLWASKIGADVRKKVHEYTEPDYGEFAQSPSVWSEQSTLDVLLATYPQKPVTDLAVASFKRTAERLGKEEFGAAMTEYAAGLLNSDREDQAVEILKAVDQLGELTPVGRFLLGNALNLLGRKGEANRVFAEFDDQPDSYYKDLALVATPSRSVPAQRRFEAAQRIFDLDGPWVNKFLALTTMRVVGTYEQQLSFARRFAGTEAPDQRQGLYAQACLAEIEGRWQDSITAYQRALKTPGPYPQDWVLQLGMLQPVTALGDAQALDDWIVAGKKIEGCEISAYLHHAYLAKEQGDLETRLACLREVLGRSPDSDETWQAATLSGAHIGQLSVELKQAAGRHPYSWRARLLLALIRQLEGDPKATEDANISDLYREDALTFMSQSFELMNSLLEEGMYLGRVSEQDYRRQVELHFLGLVAAVDRFGYDADLWGQFTSFGQLNERNAQILVAMSKYIPFKPESAPVNLRPLLLLAALNFGDTAQIEALAKLPYEPTEGDDPAWLYASYIASIGRDEEALKLIATLKPSTPRLLPRMEAMRTYLLAKTGQEKEARARLALPVVDDLIVRAYRGLAWAALDEWGKAEALLAEQAKSRNWAFLYVSAHAMRVLDDRYRTTGRVGEAQGLAYSAGAAQPSNPLFLRFSFGANPGVEQFAGTTSLDCAIEDDILCLKSMSEEGKKTYGFGKFEYTVTPQGALSGSFSDQAGNKYPFAGKVDALGNFRGQANLNGRKFNIASKLAPPALYSTFEAFKSTGLVVELVDDQGYRVAIVAGLKALRTEPASR
jgi:tetratricopeptide (TPR) repeat protein